MAEEAHQDEQERDDKEDYGAQALGFDGQFGDDSVDGDDQSCDALPGHHRLGVPPRQHARETIVARLLNCTTMCVHVCMYNEWDIPFMLREINNYMYLRISLVPSLACVEKDRGGWGRGYFL